MNKYYFLLLFLTALASCNTDVGNFQIGEDLVDTKSSIVMVDSFMVKLSTVLLDSIPTSNPGQALVGKFEHTSVGTTELRTYFNFDFGNDASGINEDDIFDSITVKLDYSGYSIGDTTALQQISLYRLTEQLAFRENEASQSYLFNTSSFSHETTPVGSYSFMPYPSRNNIEFRIDDSLGKEIMEMVLNDADEVSTNTKFKAYLKGFALSASDESRSIIGFNSDTTSIQLRLYTHRLGYELEEKEYTFQLAAEGSNYNQAITNRSGTDYAPLAVQKEELPSTQSGNLTYIQGSTGVVTRIDFPTLNEIYTYNDRVLIKAELVLVPSTLNDENFMPETLHFYTTDRINRFGNNLTITASDNTEVSVEASLVMDLLYHENSYYVVDISEFLLDALAGNYYDTNEGLLVTLPTSDLLNKADLLILNGEHANDYQPKLNLYFLKYE